MADDPQVILSDRRRKILEGTYDGAKSTEYNHKRAIRQRSQSAIEELIKIASSPEIDNERAIDPEQIGALVSILVQGSGGLVGTENIDNEQLKAWSPDPDTSRKYYVEIDAALHGGPVEEDQSIDET